MQGRLIAHPAMRAALSPTPRTVWHGRACSPYNVLCQHVQEIEAYVKDDPYVIAGLVTNWCAPLPRLRSGCTLEAGQMLLVSLLCVGLHTSSFALKRASDGTRRPSHYPHPHSAVQAHPTIHGGRGR